MEDDKLGIILTKEQWELIRGELEDLVFKKKAQQEGWREDSSPWRRIGAEIKAAQDILDALNDPERMLTPGNLPYQ